MRVNMTTFKGGVNITYEQLNIDYFLSGFPYKITKPIRLIEAFAGIGSQNKALKNINANFEPYKIIENDKYAVSSYNAIHGTNFVVSDITKVHADELEIVETNKYEYIFTYSFPCQDLSLAGNGKGMTKGTGTRSGLLWEVERILTECKELPQILLMENVTQVHNKKNIEDFKKWLSFLESLGYSNFYEDLNAKDYGIPQTRKRCFMISILGDYMYTFPKPVELKLKLKDMLEKHVDKKYYLSEKMIEYISYPGTKDFKNGDCRINLDIARPLTTAQNKRAGTTNCVSEDLPGNCDLRLLIKEKTKKGYAIACEGDGVYINRPHQKRGVVQKNIIQTIKTSVSDVGVVVAEKRFFKQAFDTLKANECAEGDTINAFNQNVDKSGIAPTLTTRPEGFKTAILLITKELKIRKLTPLECWRLMGFSDYDYEKASKVNSNTQLYKQAGNSIVVNVLEAIFNNLL